MTNSPYIRIYHQERAMYEVEINYDHGSTMAASAIKNSIEDCERYIERRLDGIDLDEVPSPFKLDIEGRDIPIDGLSRILKKISKYNKKIRNK